MDVVKSVNVLVILGWVAPAWNEVKSVLWKAGLLNDVLEVVGLDHAGADVSVDPFNID